MGKLNADSSSVPTTSIGMVYSLSVISFYPSNAACNSIMLKRDCCYVTLAANA